MTRPMMSGVAAIALLLAAGPAAFAGPVGHAGEQDPSAAHAHAQVPAQAHAGHAETPAGHAHGAGHGSGHVAGHGAGHGADHGAGHAAHHAAHHGPTGAAASTLFSAQRLSDHIKVLASDEFAGRFPGEVGEELTLDYLQAQYEAMGLEPGGPNGEWRQPVDLVRLTPERAPTGSWTAADGTVHPLTAGVDFNLRAGPADADVSFDRAPLVFAGYGIVAPERNWDDYGDMDLTGKVVVFLRGQPESFGADPNFYGSSEHKSIEAIERGAVGVLTLAEDDARWLRSVRGAGHAFMAVAGESDPSVVGTINRATGAAMAGLDEQGLAALLTSAKAGGAFKARDLGASISVDVDEAAETVRSHNLLARIPGTTRPDEVLVYSAHWDHIGKADEPNAEGDDIFNGAWDNASGTSGVIEMARAFKAGPAPERTIVFLHVTAEEQGLLGSEWYGENPVYPLEKTAANINIDMLPFTGPTRSVALFGIGKSELETDLEALAAAQGGRYLTGDGEPEQGYYYRSDHFNFAVHGVPALMPWTGVDFVEGGEAVGRPYFTQQMATYYHNLEDEWRADYDFTAAVQNLDLLFQLGQGVANSEAWPQWKAGSEFIAIRAESDAARN